MERQIFNKLTQWKEAVDRKPLILRGARQVGKTWLMNEFGKKAFKEVVYINFESNKSLHSIFEGDYRTERIIAALQIASGKQIDPHHTLLLFDEIQACDGALTSLKYFCEEAPEYPIVAAGSLLGIAMHQSASFPVGKVDFLDITPMSFEEFLWANDQKALAELLKKKDWEMISTFSSTYIQLLRQYYYVGGMPEAVKSFVNEKDYKRVRQIQNRLLSAYEQDFSKHAPYDLVPRIRLVWQSIPTQLSKENRKFIYGVLRTGARAKDFEMAIMWLTDAGLLHKVQRCSKPGIPLQAYQDFTAFKLYFVDIGLLGAMGNIDVATLLEGNTIFQEFKGAMSEQYVLQELKTTPDLPVYYWTNDKSSAEVDFIIQHEGQVIPIEVKAEENLHAKSLKSYTQLFKPERAIRSSMSDYREETWMTNLPLYAISTLHSK